MDFTQAVVTITGTAPYSQSHKHDEPKLEGEQPDAYDLRTWRSKMNTEIIRGKPTMVIPSFGLHLALISGAQYSKKKIEGQRNATWTAKFQRGISIMGAAPLNINPADVQCITLSVNADGKRGGGTRVTRRFPQIPADWNATFEVMILDPIITRSVFESTLEDAGLFVGLGQYRPESGGSNGRFVVKSLKWDDNRRSVEKRAA
jgi:hypothetical protein